MKDDSISLLSSFLSRRSIRRFSSKPVEETVVQKVVEVGQHAPTACNLQTYSIVWVQDQELRVEVLNACGIDDSIGTAPVVLVVCADVRRLSKVLDQLGYDHCLKHRYGYSIKLMSIMDAAFAAENMTMAAECLGLGSVFVGSALANGDLVKMLKLPHGVLPLTLLCLGVPDEQPPTRPRWALNSVLHVDNYRDPSSSEVKSFLKGMDNELGKEGYYQKYGNQRSDYRYSNHIKHKTALQPMKKHDAQIVAIVEKAGFLPRAE